MVSVITTAIADDTPLAVMQDNGEFEQLTEREVIEEEILLIKKLNMKDNCYFFGSHANNLIGVSVYFKYKDRIIDKINNRLAELEDTKPEMLDSTLKRQSV